MDSVVERDFPVLLRELYPRPVQPLMYCYSFSIPAALSYSHSLTFK